MPFLSLMQLDKWHDESLLSRMTFSRQLQSDAKQSLMQLDKWEDLRESQTSKSLELIKIRFDGRSISDPTLVGLRHYEVSACH